MGRSLILPSRGSPTSTVLIEGFHTVTPGGLNAVDMDPTRTKDMASTRIQKQHFTASTQTPFFYTNRTPHNWDNMEDWFQDMFHTTYAPDTNPAYEHIMDSITAQELHYRIKCLRKNKARGRSGITAGILQLLDSETVKQSGSSPCLMHAC